MMIIKFCTASMSVPKKVKVLVEDRVIDYFDLSDKDAVIHIAEEPATVCIEVAYEQDVRKKLLGVLVFFLTAVFGVNGDEIIQALYIDTLTIHNLKQDIEVKYHRKKPLFSVSEAIDYEIQRKVKKSDYFGIFVFFLFPLIVLFTVLFCGFMTLAISFLMKVVFGVILGGLDIFCVYLAITLYLKTK